MNFDDVLLSLVSVAVDRLEKRLSGMIMKATVAVEFTLIAFSIQPTNDCLDTARRCGRGGGYWTLGEGRPRSHSQPSEHRRKLMAPHIGEAG